MVNAGVYIFKKSVLKFLKKNKEMDAVTFNTLRLKKKKQWYMLCMKIGRYWIKMIF